MLNAILGDVWIYVCLAGLLLSGAALPFLIKRYRAEPVSGPGGLSPSPEDDPPPEELSVEPVKVVDASSLKESAPAKEKLTPADPKTLKTGQTMPGGISPAIVYLQNLKLQIEHFEKEIHELRSQVSGFAKTHDQQFHDLLDRMGDMQKELHHQVVAHEVQAKPAAAKPAAVQAAAAKPAVKPAAIQAPVVKQAAKPDSQPAPVAKPVPKPAPKPAPVKAKVESKPEPKPAPAAKPAPKPAVELKSAEVKKAPAKATAEEIASTLTLNAPNGPSEKAEQKDAPAKKEEAAPPKQEEDILKPEKGKGPVWPV